MSRGLGVRFFLTLLALGCVVSAARLAFGPTSGFPLRLLPLHNGLYRIEPLPHFSLPPGLHAGDLLPIRRLRPAARAAVLSSHNIAPDSAITLPIIRDGRRLTVAVRAVPESATTLELAEFLGFQAVMFTIAMLTLWRGRDWAAWGLSALFLSALLIAGPLQLPVGLRWVFWRHEIRALAEVVMITALYVFADALAGASLTARLRTAARVSFGICLFIILVLRQARYTALIHAGVSLLAHGYPQLLLPLSFLMPLLVLLVGYRHAAYEDRLRIRWVLWSTAFIFLSNLLEFAAPVSWQIVLSQVVIVLQALATLGFLYAVLRTRLIDVGFVVDRALVLGLLTALVFGTFSILELALHQFAVSDRVGWALQALAALVLAIVLSPLHKRLENWIEQAFFRSQRLALLALERLARECPFVEQEAHLLELAIERIKPQCAGVAIYERAGNGYRRRAASEPSWPAVVDADDPIFVALRAQRQPVALEAQANQVGPEGLALPMTVAESVLGALVCRPRDGEQFAPEIRAALANVAHHLGMAIIGLRHREHARLVADMAAGRIDAEVARRRAIALVEGEPMQVNLPIAS